MSTHKVIRFGMKEHKEEKCNHQQNKSNLSLGVFVLCFFPQSCTSNLLVTSAPALSLLSQDFL